MAKTRFFKTGISLSITDGGEHELSLILSYDFTPGFSGSRDEPPYGASAEIEKVRVFSDRTEIATPTWLAHLVVTDKALHDALVADAQEQDASDRAEAEERRAEDRAERLREEA